jgi:GNAT superfamily N-acetyltransferase
MRLQKIYSQGKIINADLYKRLQDLDAKVFYECGNEFKKNRDWWVIVEDNQIVAYCGCLYSTTENICIFVRAWVYEPYRGKGLQRRMIATRIQEAKKNKRSQVITYTLTDNPISANNLIKRGFRIYEPQHKWVGKGVIYFIKSV